MLRQGPIPAFIHGLLDYAVGVLCIAAPFLFAFSGDGSATAVAIVAGVLILVIAASSALTTSLIKSIPLPAHVVLDYLVAALLIAAPFLFGFSDDGAATPFFIVLGVVQLLLTIATRFVPEDRPPRRARRGGEQPVARRE
jgi:hypothetical protein